MSAIDDDGDVMKMDVAGDEGEVAVALFLCVEAKFNSANLGEEVILLSTFIDFKSGGWSTLVASLIQTVDRRDMQCF